MNYKTKSTITLKETIISIKVVYTLIKNRLITNAFYDSLYLQH